MMRIAFTSMGTDPDSQIDPRFGRTEYFLLYDEEKNEYTSIDNREVEGVAHGAGPQTARLLFDLHPDLLITGNGPGGNAAAVLKQAKLRILVGAAGMSVNDAYAAYKEGRLKEF